MGFLALQDQLNIYYPKQNQTEQVNKYNLLHIFNITLNTEISITLH